MTDTDTTTTTDIATCGTCGRSWDDSIVTGMTPVPSARCPFENFHHGEPIPDDYPVRPIPDTADTINGTHDSPTDTVRGLNAYELANMAGCASPDTRESSGAQFLEWVRDAVVDHWDYCTGDWDDDAYHEIADGAPAVYTYTRWQQFVDLAAYQEDPESGEWSGDLTEAAGIALYQIAERLVYALVDELRELTVNLEDPDTDPDDDIPARLEYLRGEIRAERISMSEVAELQGLADHIGRGDAELREWAGIPEHDDTDTDDTEGRPADWWDTERCPNCDGWIYECGCDNVNDGEE